MAEPQPAAVREGAADAHAPTGTAEDRKAAAALSTLDTAADDAAEKKEVDGKALYEKALGTAMQGLDVKDQKSDEKKVVKIEAADVTLLVCGEDRSGEFMDSMKLTWTGFRTRALQAEGDRATPRT
jgi:hypothetical protein